MPISNSDLSSQITFNLSTGYFNIEDTTDYALFGIVNPATVKVYYDITFPTGSTREGDFLTPDIANSIASSTWNTLLLPIDGSGNVQEGGYTITQYIRIAGSGAQDGDYELQLPSIEFCDERPTADVSETVDCVRGTVTVKDTTTYDPDWTYSARTFEVTDSVGSQQSTAGSLIVFSYPQFYSGTWTWTLTVTVTQDYGTHIVTGPLESSTGTTPASGQFSVQCADWCSVYCCIKSNIELYQSKVQQEGIENPSMYTKQLWYKLSMTQLYLWMITGSEKCSEPQNISTFTSQIATLLNCTGDCGCGGDEPRLIVPIAVAANSYVFHNGTRTVVTGAGNDVTYSVDANTDQRLTNLYNTTVSSTPLQAGEIELEVNATTTAGNPDTIDFNVRFPKDTLLTYQSEQACIATVTWGGGGPIVNTSRKTVYGTHFDNAANIVPLYFNGATFTEVAPVGWASLPAMFKVKEFNNTSPSGTNNWKGQVDIVGATLNAPPPAISTNPVPQIYLQYHDASPENDYWYILMVDMYGTGAPTFGALQLLWSEFQLQITIES